MSASRGRGRSSRRLPGDGEGTDPNPESQIPRPKPNPKTQAKSQGPKCHAVALPVRSADGRRPPRWACSDDLTRCGRRLRRRRRPSRRARLEGSTVVQVPPLSFHLSVEPRSYQTPGRTQNQQLPAGTRRPRSASNRSLLGFGEVAQKTPTSAVSYTCRWSSCSMRSVCTREHVSRTASRLVFGRASVSITLIDEADQLVRIVSTIIRNASRP